MINVNSTLKNCSFKFLIAIIREAIYEKKKKKIDINKKRTKLIAVAKATTIYISV